MRRHRLEPWTYANESLQIFNAKDKLRIGVVMVQMECVERSSKSVAESNPGGLRNVSMKDDRCMGEAFHVSEVFRAVQLNSTTNARTAIMLPAVAVFATTAAVTPLCL